MSSTSDRGMGLLAWMIVFTVLCLMILGLRFWAAILTRRPFHLDDAMVVFAFANTFALEGIAVWAIWNGMGKHTLEIDAYEFSVQFKLIFSATILWLLGTVFIKFSVLWLYMRLFPTPNFKFWARILFGFSAAYGIGFLVTFMNRCQPISHMWTPTDGGSCRDITIDEITSVVANIVLDTAIIVLPLPALWGLQLALRSKIAVTIMFCIGLLTVGIMCWRLDFSIKARGNTDFVYDMPTLSLISFLELWLGVIVACIPTLAPLFKAYIKPAVMKITGRGKSTNHSRPRKAVATIGGTGGSGSQNRVKSYQQLDEENSPYGSLEEVQLTKIGALSTECKYEPQAAATPPTEGGIVVRKDFDSHSRETWTPEPGSRPSHSRS